MKILILILSLIISFRINANDGAYYASGNQLIPIQETDIRVQKEVLHIKKIKNKFIEVSVYYEFFNPKEEKQLLVGFEAFSPEGDVDGAPKNGQHPYMHDFTVNINNEPLSYEVACVSDKLYNQGGNIKAIDLAHFTGNKSGNDVDFFYVYHFKARFKKGNNILRHTYTFDVSGSIDYNYYFDYVLTAANRWGNQQIDDFKLIVEMEDFEIFSIAKTFFSDRDDWQIEGIGKCENITGMENTPNDKDAVKFYVQHGKLVFHKQDFKPRGELSLFSFNNYTPAIEPVDIEFHLPFSIYQQENIQVSENLPAIQLKLLKNLPYARRGYIFKDPELHSFYSKMDWYLPNPGYVPELATLTDEERKWINKWK